MAKLSNKKFTLRKLPNDAEIRIFTCGVTGKEFTDSKGFQAMTGLSPAGMRKLKERKELPVNQIMPGSPMKFYINHVESWHNARTQLGNRRPS